MSRFSTCSKVTVVTTTSAARSGRGRRSNRPSGDDREAAILATAERLLEDRNFAEVYKKSPGVKYIVCGDFNDAPTDESVARHLNATGDVKKVLALTTPPIFKIASRERSMSGSSAGTPASFIAK